MTGENSTIDELVGVTLRAVHVQRHTGTGDVVVFTRNDGATLRMRHDQECCEYVWLQDMNGDIGDLVGEPILIAEERMKTGLTDGRDASATATFYEIRTRKGGVTMTWRGESNGYYSESVDVGDWEEVRDDG